MKDLDLSLLILLLSISFPEGGCDRGHHALQVHVGAAPAEQRQPAVCSDRPEQEDPIQRSAKVYEDR